MINGSTSSEKKTVPTICLVAGKSGGHIIPALTIAQEHKKRDNSTHIIFFSTHAQLDKNIIENDPTVDLHIPLTLDNVPYKQLYRLPIFLWQCARSFFKVFTVLRTQKPQKIISMGGYVSIPVCLAATIMGIPIDLYELNAVPGKATKALSALSSRIIICFEKARAYFPAKKCQLQTYPVRNALKNLPLSQHQALITIGFSPTRITLLIVGGSQGSVFINTMIKQLIEHHKDLDLKLQIIHQTGEHETLTWKKFYTTYQIPAHVFAYHHALEQYYQAADLIICRSGAGTLWEIVALNKQAITIPLETTVNNHQLDNAYAIAQQYPHLFTVMRQQEFADTAMSSYTNLTAKLEQLYRHKNRSL